MTWLFFFSSVTFFLFCVPLSSWFLLILLFSFRLCWARQNEGWASCYCLSCDRNSMCHTMFDIDLHLLLRADEVGVNHVRWSMYHTCCSWRVPEHVYQHCCCWNCPSFRVFISFTSLGLGFLFFMLANWYVQMCDNFCSPVLPDKIGNQSALEIWNLNTILHSLLLPQWWKWNIVPVSEAMSSLWFISPKQSKLQRSFGWFPDFFRTYVGWTNVEKKKRGMVH